MDRERAGERTDHQRVAEGFADLLDGFTGLDGTFSVERFAAHVTRSCVAIFGVAGVGLSLAGPDGWLSVAAASSKPARVLETAAVHYRQGPGPDSYSSKVPIPARA